MGEREGRDPGTPTPLRREMGEEQSPGEHGSRAERADRSLSWDDREHGHGAWGDRLRVPGGWDDEAVPDRPGEGKGLQTARDRQRLNVRRHGRHGPGDAR